MLTQVGAIVVTATLAVLNSQRLAPAPVVIGLALLLGLSTAFAIPAMQALVPLLVTREQLGPAVATLIVWQLPRRLKMAEQVRSAGSAAGA